MHSYRAFLSIVVKIVNVFCHAEIGDFEHISLAYEHVARRQIAMQTLDDSIILFGPEFEF